MVYHVCYYNMKGSILGNYKFLKYALKKLIWSKTDLNDKVWFHFSHLNIKKEQHELPARNYKKFYYEQVAALFWSWCFN